MHRPGAELAISRSQVWSPNHSTIKPPELTTSHQRPTIQLGPATLPVLILCVTSIRIRSKSICKIKFDWRPVSCKWSCFCLPVTQRLYNVICHIWTFREVKIWQFSQRWTSKKCFQTIRCQLASFAYPKFSQTWHFLNRLACYSHYHHVTGLLTTC